MSRHPRSRHWQNRHGRDEREYSDRRYPQHEDYSAPSRRPERGESSSSRYRMDHHRGHNPRGDYDNHHRWRENDYYRGHEASDYGRIGRYEDSAARTPPYQDQSAEERHYHNPLPPSPRLFMPNRPVSLPPRPQTSPPPPPPPQFPSPSYISTSLEQSVPLPSPATSRKLLILDLNGTLLFRSQHAPKTRSRYSTSGPHLRPVHPRPYMSAFRSYLFAPGTKSWLDVMVWSSAQPHSVEDMVDKAFKEKKTELVAVWARDTLGLSSIDYHRKSQTTKDLTKPWSELPLLHSTVEKDSTVSKVDPQLEAESDTATPAHSALTTLLLDDSPLKARLQPFNHLCIKEYDAGLRAKDLEIWHKELIRGREENHRKEEADEEKPLVEEGEGGQAMSTETEIYHRKRKRKEKHSHESIESNAPKQNYDETLLAIIGILDTVKTQSNVAGWVRSGGLWGRVAETRSVEESEGKESHSDAEESNEPVEAREKWKPKHEDQLEHPEHVTTNNESNQSDLATSTSQTRKSSEKPSPKKKRKLDETEEKSNNGDTNPTAPTNTGNDASTTTSNIAPVGPPVPPASMWFDNAETVAHWVVRGRKALEELGIEAAHGIER